MQKILLTRSVEENQILSASLSLQGFVPVSAPMLSYKKLDIDFTQFKDETSIIITSKFAATIIAAHYPYNVNCFVVGEESASILRQNSKLNIKHISGSAEDLPRHDNALYLSGNIITTEFDYAKRHIIYNVEYVDNLDKNMINEIKSGVKYILLYSKNCATNLIHLLKRYNLLQYIINSVVIAMSEKIAFEYEQYVEAILFPSKPKSSDILKLLVEYERERKYREK
jgi:uroporphyrinogen-III synthase